MKIQRISLRKLLREILPFDDAVDPALRKEIARALNEPDPLAAWERALSIMQSMCKAGKLKWLGIQERNGVKYIRFSDPLTGNIYSLREPPTSKAEVIPFLPRGFVGKEDATRIQSLFTSIATCRSEDELGGVLRKMLVTIREIVAADYCVIHFTDEDIKAIIPSVSDGTPRVSRRFAPHLVDRWVTQEGFCIHVANLAGDEKLRQYSQNGFFSSVVVMPVKCQTRTYGILEVWSRIESHFTSDDLGFLSLLALLAGGMIRNAENLESLIFRDPLTHVYNRGFLEDQLQREIERFRRTNQPVAFLMIDVDNFKQINTQFGHPVGDIVLSTLAHLLEDKVRQIDVVARYGGDEFGIILPDTIAEHAYVTAERLRKVIEEHDFASSFPELGGVKVTISIGGAVCPDDAMTRKEIIEVADRALAEAERKGKNCVVFASYVPEAKG